MRCLHPLILQSVLLHVKLALISIELCCWRVLNVPASPRIAAQNGESTVDINFRSEHHEEISR
jgi:hypothetical protein